MTYSKDFREKVLQIKVREKLSIAKTAKRFDIGTTTLVNWLKGKTPKGKRNKPATKIDMDALAMDIKEYSDAYIYERARRLGYSKNGVWYALKRLGVTYKKSIETSKSERRRQASFLSEDQRLSKGE
jgi:transposase